MKLLLCRACGDIVKIMGTRRPCRCGVSWAFYTDETEGEAQVTVGGQASVVAIPNSEFAQAVKTARQSDTSGEFIGVVLHTHHRAVSR